MEEEEGSKGPGLGLVVKLDLHPNIFFIQPCNFFTPDYVASFLGGALHDECTSCVLPGPIFSRFSSPLWFFSLTHTRTFLTTSALARHDMAW
jgi:hypothetical protein